MIREWGGFFSGPHTRLIKITHSAPFHTPHPTHTHSPSHDKTGPIRAGALAGDHGQRLLSHPSPAATITTIITPPCFFFLLCLPDRHGGRGPGRRRVRAARWCLGGVGRARFAGFSRWYVDCSASSSLPPFHPHPPSLPLPFTQSPRRVNSNTCPASKAGATARPARSTLTLPRHLRGCNIRT